MKANEFYKKIETTIVEDPSNDCEDLLKLNIKTLKVNNSTFFIDYARYFVGTEKLYLFLDISCMGGLTKKDAQLGVIDIKDIKTLEVLNIDCFDEVLSSKIYNKI